MKIGFITTLDTNIGDDFIRTGIENIITSIIDRSNIEFTYINKHDPYSSLKSANILKMLKKMRPFRGKRIILKIFDKEDYSNNSVYADQDLIIQSGAPVLWPNCHRNEWAIPIWYKTLGKLKDKIPILNLAAGSCYPWENQSGFLCQEEFKYASDIGSFCKLTTTRDIMAHRLFLEAGIDNTLMPCTGFFVDPNFENREKGKYILINYMMGGGHFDWGQNVNVNQWEDVIKQVIINLLKEHEVRFLCHNEKEFNQAKDLFPDLQIHYPKTVSEYLKCIRSAKIGINNRMHASVAMGSVGVPAVSIGTDTRLLMLENIGLPIHYVKEITLDILANEVNSLLRNLAKERDRLLFLKRIKFAEYQQLIKPFLQ